MDKRALLRRRLLKTATASTALFGIAAVNAQNAQNQPGRIVVPFPPGGPADNFARTVAQGFQKLLGTSYVVENRPGATGNIGAVEVMQAKPDGLTLLATNTAIVLNPLLFKKTQVVDPYRDLAPVSALGTTTHAVVIPGTVQVQSLRQWLELMRAKPSVTYGSFGVGSSNHLYAFDFANKTSLKATHVPYKGDAPVLQDLIGGQIDFCFMAVGSAKQAGDRIRVISMMGEERNPLFPDVPTLKESGISGFETGGWLGLLAPAGTPIETRRKLSDATRQILASREAQQQLGRYGLRPGGTTPERFLEMMKHEAERQSPRIQAAGASLD